VSNHDLIPSGVEQGEHYSCDGRDLTKPTVEQYEKYKDGSHRGKNKLEENEKTEAGRKRTNVRTKAGEKAKKEEVAGISREVDLAEIMRKREEQVAIQNAGKIVARKREETLEQERLTAEMKMWMEEERKDRNENKRKSVKEEWQKNAKIAEEQRKKEDKAQFDKSLAKTLAIERDQSQVSIAKKGGRKEMTSAELDQEFRDINAAQMKVNTREAIVQLVGVKLVGENEMQKSGQSGLRIMRADEENRADVQLPPVTEILSTRSRVLTENVKAVTERKIKKAVSIRPPIVEEMELDVVEVEIDFEKDQEGAAEIPQDILNEVVNNLNEGEWQGGGEIEPVETLSATFLQSLVSDKMDLDLGEEYDDRVQEVEDELEESGKEAGLNSSPS